MQVILINYFTFNYFFNFSHTMLALRKMQKRSQYQTDPYPFKRHGVHGQFHPSDFTCHDEFHKSCSTKWYSFESKFLFIQIQRLTKIDSKNLLQTKTLMDAVSKKVIMEKWNRGVFVKLITATMLQHHRLKIRVFYLVPLNNCHR